MRNMTIKVADAKGADATRNVELPLRIAENTADMVEICGSEERACDMFNRSLIIAFQGVVRGDLKKIGDDRLTDKKVIEGNPPEYVPSVRKIVDHVQRTKKAIEGLSDEGRAELLALLNAEEGK